MAKKLSDFKALTFDCYGTLIDWTQGLVAALTAVGYEQPSMRHLIELFGGFETKVQTENPTWLYPQILEEVLRRIGKATSKAVTDEQVKEFGQSVGKWPPFADTVAALKELQKHYKLVILSNVDKTSFAKSEALLQIKFDLICTAQDIGTYKPDLNNFHYVLRRVKEEFGIEKDQVLHTFQSLFHDAVPATKLGIATAHIDRQIELAGATPLPKEPYNLNFHFHTLGEMAKQYE